MLYMTFKKGMPKIGMIFCISLLVMIEIAVLFLMYKSSANKDTKLYSVNLKENIDTSGLLAIMVEQSDGTYNETSDITWPTTHIYNGSKSGCLDVKGTKLEGALTYNLNNNVVTVDTTKTSYCYMYFDIMKENLSERVMQLQWSGQVFDEGKAGFRYEGANVNNYVTFNDELWRIIGVEEGSSIGLTEGEYYTKIISNGSIGEYNYDDNGGIDWPTSTLYTLLNGDYYNRVGDYASIGLNDTSKSMIVSANWYYTGFNSREYPASGFFENERSDSTKVINNYVGIMYPSDYGYAALQSECKNTSSENYNNGSSEDCYKKDWLFVNQVLQSLITPLTSSWVWRLTNYGEVISSYFSRDKLATVRPVVYLNSNVKITNNGTGTESSSYTIGL